MLSPIVRCKQEFSHLEKTHIFFDLCQFKARATDQLVSLDNPLMSSSYLGHDDKRFLKAGAEFYWRKLTGDVCVPGRE